MNPFQPLDNPHSQESVRKFQKHILPVIPFSHIYRVPTKISIRQHTTITFSQNAEEVETKEQNTYTIKTKPEINT